MIVASTLLVLAACRPPAADEYVKRVELQQRDAAPRVVMVGPDTQDAEWASVDDGARLLFGKGGEAPLLSLACEAGETGNAQVLLTRYVAADPQAKALIAIIGNSHIARLPVETQWNGRVWLWRGKWPAASPDLEVFIGNREVEATIPGAGSVLLKGSLLPGRLIRSCALSQPQTSRPARPPK